MIPFPEVFAYVEADAAGIIHVGTLGGDAHWRSDTGEIVSSDLLELIQETVPDVFGGELVQPYAGHRMLDVDTKGRV